MAIESINPATGESLKQYTEFSKDQVIDILGKIHEAQLMWQSGSLANRARHFTKIAALLEQHKETYATLMAQEMGKPLEQGRAEIEKCAWACRYYTEHAEDFLRDLPIETEAKESFVSFQPLGIIFAIMPWNFPFWQVFRASVPALMAGNGVALKHSPNVPQCALAIEALFQEAGFPNNLFRALLIEVPGVSIVFDNPHVKAVTFTGSVKAGAHVAAEAGARIKKVVLELGGSDPYIVLADANLEKAAKTCAAARMVNGGQTCIAAKRCIVGKAVLREFEERLLKEMKAYATGDPLKEGTRLGPMARGDLRENLDRQVRQSLQAGAQLLLGGQVPAGSGNFYPATVLSKVKPKMPAYEEELFGPVASIIEAVDEEDAIRIANDTPFGLGAAIFSKDIEKAKRLAKSRIHAGCCFINDFVKSDPRLPFGGIKHSGFGRELGSFGIREFVNVKTIVIP